MIGMKMWSLRESTCGVFVSLMLATSVALFGSRSRAQGGEPQNNNRPRRAQSIPQASPTPAKNEEEVTLNSDEVVRVETNLTNIFFTAADKQKRFISNLKREDIRVLEDGVPQEIFTF